MNNQKACRVGTTIVIGCAALVSAAGGAIVTTDVSEKPPAAVDLADMASERMEHWRGPRTGPAWLDPDQNKRNSASIPPVSFDKDRSVAIEEMPPEVSPEKTRGTVRNHRGRHVQPADVPYFEDFERHAVGAEWAIAGVTRDDGLSTFAGPLALEAQNLDINTDEGAGYTMSFDLYLIVPGDDASTVAVAVNGRILFEESFRALLEIGEVDARSGAVVVRGLRTSFVATLPVTEITFASFGQSNQSWGFDNVALEVMPDVMLSEREEGAGGGGGSTRQATPRSGGESSRPSKVRPNKPGKGGGASPDIQDLIPPEEDIPETPDDPDPESPGLDPDVIDEIINDPSDPFPGPDEPPTTAMPPEDPPGGGGDGDGDVPAPGGAVVGGILAGLLLNRRRR